VLIGQVSGLAPAAHVREVFGAWRAALALADYREHQMSGQTVWLHAAARCPQVKVRLTATVFAAQIIRIWAPSDRSNHGDNDRSVGANL
jgi:hypothetical protein